MQKYLFFLFQKNADIGIDLKLRKKIEDLACFPINRIIFKRFK